MLGSQSVGKSSVLESIVGKDFLPRGKGIVTRRPIEIQMINIPKDEKDYVVFSDGKGEKIYNLEEVRKEIDNMTERIAGKMKAISSTPIRLKFFSPNVVDLLVVDLPGMTKVDFFKINKIFIEKINFIQYFSRILLENSRKISKLR